MDRFGHPKESNFRRGGGVDLTLLISERREGEAAISQAPSFAVRKQGALMAEKSEISASRF